MNKIEEALFVFIKDRDVVSIIDQYYKEQNDELDNPKTMINVIENSIRTYNVQSCNCRAHVICKLHHNEMLHFIEDEMSHFKYPKYNFLPLVDTILNVRNMFRSVLYNKIERNFKELKDIVLDKKKVKKTNDYILSLKNKSDNIISNDNMLNYLDTNNRFFMLNKDLREFIFKELVWWRLSSQCSQQCKDFINKYKKYKCNIPYIL